MRHGQIGELVSARAPISNPLDPLLAHLRGCHEDLPMKSGRRRHAWPPPGDPHED